MGVQDWSFPIASHTFVEERTGFTITNPGTAWIFLDGNWSLFRLDLISGFSSARARLMVQADMSGQPEATIAIAGASQNGAIDTDKVCVTTLRAGARSRFTSDEDLLPGGITGGLALILVVKSSTADGDIGLGNVSLVIF